MRISVKQLRRVIKEAIVNEMGMPGSPRMPGAPSSSGRSMRLCLMKDTPGESPLTAPDFSGYLRERGLTGISLDNGVVGMPSSLDSRFRELYYVYRVPNRLVDRFMQEFPDAMDAVECFQDFIRDPGNLY